QALGKSPQARSRPAGDSGDRSLGLPTRGGTPPIAHRPSSHPGVALPLPTPHGQPPLGFTKSVRLSTVFFFYTKNAGGFGNMSVPNPKHSKGDSGKREEDVNLNPLMHVLPRLGLGARNRPSCRRSKHILVRAFHVAQA